MVSFPLLLDRNVGVRQAVATSFRAVRDNPGPMAVWGLIIAAGLVIGAIPLLVGLAIVLPDPRARDLAPLSQGRRELTRCVIPRQRDSREPCSPGST